MLKKEKMPTHKIIFNFKSYLKRVDVKKDLEGA